MANRGDRLHHDERIKAKWRSRMKNAWSRAFTQGFDVMLAAAKRAHHQVCPCGMCKGERYERNRSAEIKAIEESLRDDD